MFISQAQLGLHPADLLYRAETEGDQALGDLDERILAELSARRAPSRSTRLVIRHTERLPARSPCSSWKRCCAACARSSSVRRPLRPPTSCATARPPRRRPGRGLAPRPRLDDCRGPSCHDPRAGAGRSATTLDNPALTIDAAIAAYVDAVEPLAAYRLPQAGTGFADEWRRGTYDAVRAPGRRLGCGPGTERLDQARRSC